MTSHDLTSHHLGHQLSSASPISPHTLLGFYTHTHTHTHTPFVTSLTHTPNHIGPCMLSLSILISSPLSPEAKVTARSSTAHIIPESGSMQYQHYWWHPCIILEFDKNKILINTLLVAILPTQSGTITQTCQLSWNHHSGHSSDCQ